MASPDGEVGPSTAHEMRITNHGKINRWVSFALEYFEKHEDKALVLHTLPASEGKASEPVVEDEVGNDAAAEAVKGGGLHTSMATIPRLVSVVEIIKREYLKSVNPALAEGGMLSGLHQYNEVGELGCVAAAAEGRTEALARALRGRNHVRQKKVAFMRVTLCRKAISVLGATHQKPSVRRVGRTARARARKKKD